MSKAKTKFVFDASLKLFIYATGILVIYWLLLKLLGHSPTSNQLLIVFLSFISGLVLWSIRMNFKIFGELRELKGEFKQHSRSVAQDLSKINERLDKLE